MANETQMLSVQEAAKLAGVSVRTFWRRVADCTFPPPVRYTKGCARWNRAKLEQVVAKLSKPASEQYDAAQEHLQEINCG